MRINQIDLSSFNKSLQEIKLAFSEATQNLTNKISKHKGQLTHTDLSEFGELMGHIKDYVNKKISDFIEEKFKCKSHTYQTEIDQCTEKITAEMSKLKQAELLLSQNTLGLKLEQNRKQKLMEHLSSKYQTTQLTKQYFLIWKRHRQNEKALSYKYVQMRQIYHKNLCKKVFSPWRYLTYKNGYENSVHREVQTDVLSIHKQYHSVIEILKNKIHETDELILVKKAAKSEFAYALNKNLLRTISNLSMEVMSLNQMTIQDHEFQTQSDTKRLMSSVNKAVQQKLEDIKQYTKGLKVDHKFQQFDKDDQTGSPRYKETKRKKIRFMVETGNNQ